MTRIPKKIISIIAAATIIVGLSACGMWTADSEVDVDYTIASSNDGVVLSFPGHETGSSLNGQVVTLEVYDVATNRIQNTITGEYQKTSTYEFTIQAEERSNISLSDNSAIGIFPAREPGEGSTCSGCPHATTTLDKINSKLCGCNILEFLPALTLADNSQCDTNLVLAKR